MQCLLISMCTYLGVSTSLKNLAVAVWVPFVGVLRHESDSYSAAFLCIGGILLFTMFVLYLPVMNMLTEYSKLESNDINDAALSPLLDRGEGGSEAEAKAVVSSSE